MSSILRRYPTAGLLPAATLLFLVCAAAAGAGDWKGSESTVEGQLHVQNPAEAIDPEMEIELEEVFRLGGWDGGDDEFFGIVTDIEEDADGNLYVLDSQLNEIKVYSAGGEYLNTIGREGEGPGEFRNAAGLFWMPDGRLGVMQTFPGRVVTLWPDGTSADDYTMEAVEGAGFRLMRGIERAGDNLAIVYGLNDFNQETMKFKQTNILALFDGEGAELKKVHQRDSHIDFADPKITEMEFDNFMNRWTTGADGRIYAVPVLADYAVKVWTPEGELDRVIERDYEEHPRTDEEKAELEDLYKRLTQGGGMPPNTTYEVETIHPCVNWRGIYARPDGSMWVATSRGSNDVGTATLGTFDIYDPKGRFVRQAKLNGQCNNDDDAIFFVGDRVFVITEFLDSVANARGSAAEEEEDPDAEEAEPMAIICYRSSELDAAAGIPPRVGESR
jgi:sugar lactone lactonase YvrE